MPIWTNSDGFANTYDISSLLQKFHFSIEVVLNPLETGTNVQVKIFVEFLNNFFTFGI